MRHQDERDDMCVTGEGGRRNTHQPVMLPREWPPSRLEEELRKLDEEFERLRFGWMEVPR